VRNVARSASAHGPASRNSQTPPSRHGTVYSVAGRERGGRAWDELLSTHRVTSRWLIPMPALSLPALRQGKSPAGSRRPGCRSSSRKSRTAFTPGPGRRGQASSPSAHFLYQRWGARHRHRAAAPRSTRPAPRAGRTEPSPTPTPPVRDQAVSRGSRRDRPGPPTARVGRVAEWHWEPVNRMTLLRRVLPPAALATVRQVAGELTVRRIDDLPRRNGSSQERPPGLRTVPARPR